MRLITLNLRHGGGSRISKICDYLRTADADLLVLTEFQAGGPGLALRNALADMGYSLTLQSVVTPKTNGVMIASRVPATVIDLRPEADLSLRILGCRVGGLNVYGVYFALGPAKLALYQYIARHSAVWSQRPAILIGDFNTGRHWIDEPGATFDLSDQFEELETQHGWTDAWRLIHGPDARAYTWRSPRGNEFRLDHAFVNPSALPLVRDATYDHSTRPGITDHSAMTIEIAGAA